MNYFKENKHNICNVLLLKVFIEKTGVLSLRKNVNCLRDLRFKILELTRNGCVSAFCSL